MEKEQKTNFFAYLLVVLLALDVFYYYSHKANTVAVAYIYGILFVSSYFCILAAWKGWRKKSEEN